MKFLSPPLSAMKSSNSTLSLHSMDMADFPTKRESFSDQLLGNPVTTEMRKGFSGSEDQEIQQLYWANLVKQQRRLLEGLDLSFVLIESHSARLMVSRNVLRNGNSTAIGFE
ncbi:hypothetical protein ACH5RR_015345 [Cinchona calisaya]|uniref:Uncharacterized protein n=1 Tax=Cinchona calisaya TaxID=153742 RepID=A0ABD2ZSW8_9GENT